MQLVDIHGDKPAIGREAKIMMPSENKIVIQDHNEGHGVMSIFYEAYEEMALKVMREIVEESQTRFPSTLTAVYHRLGELKIGDAAVVVSVAAAHRKVTFEACAWVIDELKARVPIFKHERREGGEVWVGLGP